VSNAFRHVDLGFSYCISYC